MDNEGVKTVKFDGKYRFEIPTLAVPEISSISFFVLEKENVYAK